MTLPEFQRFPKIPRLNRDIVVTEKIDGTNAQIYVPEDDGPLLAGSRKRWITPELDNFGFARWVHDNAEQLKVELGYGLHFGEWWGQGIQRRYDQDRKRFSLFNVKRWAGEELALCDVVPVLYEGLFHERFINEALEDLELDGSRAAPGFRKPEGIIVFHTAASQLFKVTCEDDEKPKGQT